MAVKQYGWFYAMEGRHRSSYVTESGECYDVRDSTGDQLYKPEKARIVNKHHTALDVTWKYHLRKDGKQFLTGYRTGNKGACAFDATGWKLFARSAVRCAEDLGYDWKQILHAYYGPGMHIVDQDGIIVGSDGQAIGDASVIGSTLEPGSGPHTFDERHDAIEWHGDWQRTRSDAAYKRTLTYSSDRSSSAEFKVAALSLQLIAKTGPQRGRISVYVDGDPQGDGRSLFGHEEGSAGRLQLDVGSGRSPQRAARAGRAGRPTARRHRRDRRHPLGRLAAPRPPRRDQISCTGCAGPRRRRARRRPRSSPRRRTRRASSSPSTGCSRACRSTGRRSGRCPARRRSTRPRTSR